jgi:hypothetical protein
MSIAINAADLKQNLRGFVVWRGENVCDTEILAVR